MSHSEIAALCLTVIGSVGGAAWFLGLKLGQMESTMVSIKDRVAELESEIKYLRRGENSRDEV